MPPLIPFVLRRGHIRYRVERIPECCQGIWRNPRVAGSHPVSLNLSSRSFILIDIVTCVFGSSCRIYIVAIRHAMLISTPPTLILIYIGTGFLQNLELTLG